MMPQDTTTQAETDRAADGIDLGELAELAASLELAAYRMPQPAAGLLTAAARLVSCVCDDALDGQG